MARGAAVFRVSLSRGAEWHLSLSLASVTAMGKESPMEKRWAVGVLTLVLLVVLPGAGAAWNRAGHMVSGAIAYSELTQASATALARVVDLLKAHPDFPTKWTAEMAKPFVPPAERDLYLFMLAARWPDNIRDTQRYDRPPWHYINRPLLPVGVPTTVPPVDPTAVHIRSAYAMNLAILQSAAPNSERAVALCWLLHLIGDVHQPLHTVTFVTPQFPAPQGDRGGTRFFIRVRADRSTISLHEFWDGLVLGSSRFQTVRNTATALRLRPAHARGQLAELAQPQFAQWEQESFELAHAHAYRNGTLPGSADSNNGVVLPADYAPTVKPMGERRIILAGYRVADVLRQLFE